VALAPSQPCWELQQQQHCYTTMPGKSMAPGLIPPALLPSSSSPPHTFPHSPSCHPPTRLPAQTLFNYIEGANADKAKIPMTAPVLMRITPGEGPFCKSNFTMGFYLPWNRQAVSQQREGQGGVGRDRAGSALAGCRCRKVPGPHQP
jgi:hypothetical protein